MNAQVFVTADHSNNRYIGAKDDLIRFLGNARTGMAPIPSFHQMGETMAARLLMDAGARAVYVVDKRGVAVQLEPS